MPTALFPLILFPLSLSLSLSRYLYFYHYPSLSVIAVGNFSWRHPGSTQRWWIYVYVLRLTRVCLCAGPHNWTSPMSSSLRMGQCPVCLGWFMSWKINRCTIALLKDFASKIFFQNNSQYPCLVSISALMIVNRKKIITLSILNTININNMDFSLVNLALVNVFHWPFSME